MKPNQDEMNEYLDDLRESGEVNMFECVPNVLRKFPELDQKEAEEMVSKWMRTFGDRHQQSR